MISTFLDFSSCYISINVKVFPKKSNSRNYRFISSFCDSGELPHCPRYTGELPATYTGPDYLDKVLRTHAGINNREEPLIISYTIFIEIISHQVTSHHITWVAIWYYTTSQLHGSTLHYITLSQSALSPVLTSIIQHQYQHQPVSTPLCPQSHHFLHILSIFFQLILI